LQSLQEANKALQECLLTATVAAEVDCADNNVDSALQQLDEARQELQSLQESNKVLQESFARATVAAEAAKLEVAAIRKQRTAAADKLAALAADGARSVKTRAWLRQQLAQQRRSRVELEEQLQEANAEVRGQWRSSKPCMMMMMSKVLPAPLFLSRP
jgi:chromosome segregation ATPase